MIDSMPASVVPWLGRHKSESIPCVGVGYRQTYGMRARDILSQNLRKLIEDAKTSKPQLGAIKKVAERSSELTHGTTTLSKSRVGRIAKGSHPTDIDALNDLAQVFGLQPWQLLVENLNPKALPHLADAALLSQIKQIVNVVQAPNEEISPSPKDELPLQKGDGGRRRKQVGPALQAAFKGNGNAGSGSAQVTKHKGRGRR